MSLGITPRIAEIPFDSIDDAILYALKHQKSRRNLTESQMIMLDVSIHDAEEKIAARMRQATLNRPNRDEAVLGVKSTLSSKGKSAISTAQKIGAKEQDIKAIEAAGTDFFGLVVLIGLW